MKKTCYLLTLIISLAPLYVYSQQWEKLGDDDMGDGFLTDEPDIKAFHHYYDKNTDTVMFLFEMHDDVNPDTFGLNVALNIEGAGSTTTWFGAQNTVFELNRLLTFWLQQTPSGPTGIIGIADATGVENDDLSNLNNLGLKVLYNNIQNYYILMAKRSDIFQTTEFNAVIIGSVGLPGSPNDDIPDQGSFTIADTQVVTVLSNVNIPILRAYPNPSHGKVTISLPEASFSEFAISVLNILGQPVHTEKYTSNINAAQVELDLSSLENGIYHLLLESHEGKYTSRVLLK